MALIRKRISSEVMRSPVKHMLVIGLSGRGKDNFMEYYLTQKIGKYKVVDLHSLERYEGFFYGIENQDRAMVRRIAYLTNNRLKPQAFKHEIKMVLGRGILNFKSLPQNVEVVTLDEKDLTNEDLVDFVADTKSAKYLLYMIFYFNRGRAMTLTSLLDYLKMIIESLKKRKKGEVYKDFLLPPEEAEMFKAVSRLTIFVIIRNVIFLKNSGIFNDNPRFKRLNLQQMISDRNTLTTISCMLVDSDIERVLVETIIMKKLVDSRKFKMEADVPVMVGVREFQHFYSRGDNEEVSEVYRLIKKQFKFCLEQGRDLQIILAVNFQKPKQVPPIISTHFSKIMALGMTRKDAEFLLNWATIPPETLHKLQSCERGQGMYISNGEWRFLMELIPTLHMKKVEGFPVLSFLEERYGKQDLTDLTYETLFGNEGDDFSEKKFESFPPSSSSRPPNKENFQNSDIPPEVIELWKQFMIKELSDKKSDGYNWLRNRMLRKLDGGPDDVYEETPSYGK